MSLHFSGGKCAARPGRMGTVYIGDVVLLALIVVPCVKKRVQTIAESSSMYTMLIKR